MGMQCGGADQPCTVSKRIKQTNGMVKNRCAQNDTAAHRNKKRNQSDRSDGVSAEMQIEQQDKLVREVKRKHSLSQEEVVRKEIPGLERKGMYWMRDLIYKRGTTA